MFLSIHHSDISASWQAHKCRGDMSECAVCSVVHFLTNIQMVVLDNVMTLIKCSVQSI